ncbi:uncharacterized protein UV8b_04601 [Ustilaginoidea virens]|uniref:J domain-containing protein n=1 Tax=Ustilaginoidea virens TaxID=1159556 RepID=A0A8E5HRK3_USTVR|nr:uncharacterized protein UV8b_04601 [Ustilaginoidea virens]QUC20360.1 hypothetical protein UV8b_04601 [Ustilaginoidea virens]
MPLHAARRAIPRLHAAPIATPPASLRHARLFHPSPPTPARDVAGQTHYERLGIQHDASHGEIKKHASSPSFYSLSKAHHPDVSRDPAAAHTFALLSESYAVLSDPGRRARYDREIVVRAAPRAPAGGRSPSGLSRRRGSFRGPPPSFYRNAAWAGGKPPDGPAGRAPRAGGGRDDDDHHHHRVPHFDEAAHARTQRREDERRWRRRALGDDGVEFEPQTTLAGHFFIVASILGATFAAPLVYLQLTRWRKHDGRA